MWSPNISTMHRSEHPAGKTESSVAIKVEINTTVGGQVIRRRLRRCDAFLHREQDCTLWCAELKMKSLRTFGTQPDANGTGLG
jgi:hypothetical protein